MAGRTLADYLATTSGIGDFDEQSDPNNFVYPPSAMDASLAGFDLGGMNLGGFDLGAAEQQAYRTLASIGAIRKAGAQNVAAANLSNGSNLAQAAALAQAQALGARSAAQTALVKGAMPNQRRMQPLGVNSTGTVAASATVSLSVSPLVVFKPRRFIVPATIGANFNVIDIKVNQTSQFINSNPITALAFTEDATTATVDWDTCQPQGLIIVTVQNTDAGAAHAFNAVLYGECAT